MEITPGYSFSVFDKGRIIISNFTNTCKMCGKYLFRSETFISGVFVVERKSSGSKLHVEHSMISINQKNIFHFS